MSYSHGELVQLAEEGRRKKMPRYIDADALTLKVDDWRVDLEETYGKNDEYVQCLESVLDMIEDAPTADVVEVVRCKECEFWNYKKLMCECPEWADMDGWHKCSDADDYCFRAERKEKIDVE